jgi:tRNA/tmRNA/rRNA uracil-C5-methylase (TrmA/RlmC/RlmD family)
MKPGDTITVMAEAMSKHGDGIGVVEGVEIHVAGLLPGETGDVSLDYVSRQRPRAHGSVLSRRNSHPGRREAPCVHHGRCSGCAMMAMDIDSQRRLKRVELARQYGVEIDRMVAPDEAGLHYRWSSKRVFAGSPGVLVLGSYMRGTHNVADMSGCLVDHPDIVDACDELLRVCNRLDVTAYEELDEVGDFRYAWLKTDGRGNVLLTLITSDPYESLIDEVAAELSVPAGIAWGVNSGRNNDMRGVTLRPIRGRQSLEIDVCGVEAHVGPLGFLQPNPAAAAMAFHDLVRVPAGGLPHGRVALDLYAGTGVTTALLQEHFETVAACESYPESARALGIRPQLVEEFLAEILADHHHAYRLADLVVANPPRGGLGPTVCDQLNRLHSPRLHIMSCSPPSLAEDLKRLTGPQGSYRLIQARGFDTLSQTAHVEVVAWLVGRS